MSPKGDQVTDRAIGRMSEDTCPWMKAEQSVSPNYSPSSLYTSVSASNHLTSENAGSDEVRHSFLYLEAWSWYGSNLNATPG